jgi:hypothetical protein
LKRFRKLREEGAPDLASAGKKDVGAGSSSGARSTEEPEEASNWGEAKTRCPCGNSKDQGVMIQVQIVSICLSFNYEVSL